MVPLNMAGLVIGIMRLSDRSRKWRLNWLGDHPQRESIYLFRNLFYPLGGER